MNTVEQKQETCLSLNDSDQYIIDYAINILSNAFKKESLMATSADKVKTFCRLNLGSLEHEVFSVLFLDSSHQLIKFKKMFNGTINSAAVYIREIAKVALQLNAESLILCHNHPSGDVTPSDADIRITQEIQRAVAVFDIRVLDHIIVSSVNSHSFVEHEMMERG